MSLGTFLHDELSAPLGLDFWIGLPADQHHRVAPLEVIEFPDDPTIAAMVDQFMGPETMPRSGALRPGQRCRPRRSPVSTCPRCGPRSMPAANGITNARSLAKLYASCVSEVPGTDGAAPLFTDETAARAVEHQTSGVDQVMMGMDLIGLGFNVPNEMMKLGGHRSFGHYGAGGSVGFADPDQELGFGYVMNKMTLGLSGDPRTATLIDAVYAAIEQRS